MSEQMTAKEAITALKLEKITIEGNAIRVADFFRGLAVANTALEKQIPKKPTKEIMDNGVDILGESDIEHDFCCPVCCNVVGMFDGNENLPFADYCDNCGQALDWSDTE